MAKFVDSYNSVYGMKVQYESKCSSNETHTGAHPFIVHFSQVSCKFLILKNIRSLNRRK